MCPLLRSPLPLCLNYIGKSGVITLQWWVKQSSSVWRTHPRLCASEYQSNHSLFSLAAIRCGLDLWLREERCIEFGVHLDFFDSNPLNWHRSVFGPRPRLPHRQDLRFQNKGNPKTVYLPVIAVVDLNRMLDPVEPPRRSFSLGFKEGLSINPNVL